MRLVTWAKHSTARARARANVDGLFQPGEGAIEFGGKFGVDVAEQARRHVMIARSLVAQRALDQDEIGRLAYQGDLARRGDADQEPATRGEHLLGHQYGIGRSDRAANDAEALAGVLEAVHFAVVAGP